MGWWLSSPLILRGKMAFSSVAIVSRELSVCICSDQRLTFKSAYPGFRTNGDLTGGYIP